MPRVYIYIDVCHAEPLWVHAPIHVRSDDGFTVLLKRYACIAWDSMLGRHVVYFRNHAALKFQVRNSFQHAACTVQSDQYVVSLVRQVMRSLAGVPAREYL